MGQELCANFDSDTPATFMKQSPTWESNNLSANQEISRILWNREVNYVHKVRLLVRALGHINPINPPTVLYIQDPF